MNVYAVVQNRNNLMGIFPSRSEADAYIVELGYSNLRVIIFWLEK